MTSTLYQIQQAISADITANVALPTKTHVQLGAPRLVETDKNLPLLNVFSPKSDASRLTTDTYTEWHDHITVGWYTGTPAAMETGVIPDADVQAHMAVSEAIESRAVLWVPTIPGLSFQNETYFEEVIRGKVRGNVLGTEVKLRVTRWRS